MITSMMRKLHTLWPKRPKLPKPETVEFVARMREARAYGLEQTRASHKETRRMTRQSVIERSIVSDQVRRNKHDT